MDMEAYAEASMPALMIPTYRHPFVITDESRILPAAEPIWKQAWTCYIQAEKLKLRSHRMATWADEQLLPPWSVGEGPIPQHLLTDPEMPALLGEMFSRHGQETLRLLSRSLDDQSQIKESEANALWRAIEEVYKDDRTGLSVAHTKLDSFIRKDRLLTIRQLDYQESRLRNNVGELSAFRLLNPNREGHDGD